MRESIHMLCSCGMLCLGSHQDLVFEYREACSLLDFKKTSIRLTM